MIISIEFFRVYVLLWSCWKKAKQRRNTKRKWKEVIFLRFARSMMLLLYCVWEQVRMDMKKGTLKTNEQQVLVEKVLCEREKKTEKALQKN